MRALKRDHICEAGRILPPALMYFAGGSVALLANGGASPHGPALAAGALAREREGERDSG